MLAVIVYEAPAQGRTLDDAILHAAVHGWYEGHIAGEDGAGRLRALPEPAPVEEGATPSPPFPDPNSSLLAGILHKTKELFTSDELAPAAVCHAAGMAYAAGYVEGKRCPGCSFRGRNEVRAADVRAGRFAINLANGVATSVQAERNEAGLFDVEEE